MTFPAPTEYNMHLRICHFDQGGCPRGVMVKAMDCGIVVASSYSSHAITITFRQIPLGKV